MQTSAIRQIGFDAGHRVHGHESKCATFHGHRYTAEIYCKAIEGALDGLGRVIDFSVIKTKIGAWIDTHWDHAMVVWKNDPDLPHIKACTGFKPVFECDFNPTAENMAAFLLNHVCPSLLTNTGVIVHRIRLWETPNCYVEVDLC
ncbi:COG0720 6-pyruvoyl-tetrahydropterin synthase [uncultured Caudovirales phage]|uniref:COG0720 6-pyruvoyl-tetrahydropterin synthase n=1 Tax=uncultured Caudovirales phage TaxID=2100421 RepID=A0A6J5MUA5_9CAUD|nr:COG0720 6-pyruvoyl-tetrahydropterin synthase [uncultured Caudovirales phage]